jgi:hypothetical protein
MQCEFVKIMCIYSVLSSIHWFFTSLTIQPNTYIFLPDLCVHVSSSDLPTFIVYYYIYLVLFIAQ